MQPADVEVLPACSLQAAFITNQDDEAEAYGMASSPSYEDVGGAVDEQHGAISNVKTTSRRPAHGPASSSST